MKIKLFTLAFAVTAMAMLAVVAGCKKQDGATKPDNVDYYTCTMHPSVRSQDPKAKCPICSMDLVPVTKKGAPAGHDHGQKKNEAKSMGMSPE